ncbi:MAG: hypothetical protein M3R50_08605 [Bacteroidota bacterium]|nr:hypothetical protein [Bacteroidota bacterium]
MVAVRGTYQNGFVKLEKDYPSDNPVKVIVTFLEEAQTIPEKVIDLSDFSFSKSQKNLENFNGSLSSAVIEDRRMEL